MKLHDLSRRTLVSFMALNIAVYVLRHRLVKHQGVDGSVHDDNFGLASKGCNDIET